MSEWVIIRFQIGKISQNLKYYKLRIYATNFCFDFCGQQSGKAVYTAVTVTTSITGITSATNSTCATVFTDSEADSTVIRKTRRADGKIKRVLEETLQRSDVCEDTGMERRKLKFAFLQATQSLSTFPSLSTNIVVNVNTFTTVFTSTTTPPPPLS